MIRTLSLLMATVTLTLAGVGQASAGTIYPINNGFETPNLGGGYGYGPDGAGAGLPALPSSAGTGWTFQGTSGIAANGSAFGVTGATNGNSDGTKSSNGQAGFIQSITPDQYGGAYTFAVNSISQVVNLQSGLTSVTFSLEARANGGGNNPIDVSLGGVDLGTYEAPLGVANFTSFTTSSIFLSAGTYTLAFTGTDPTGKNAIEGDNTQFLDNVSLTNTPTPEPASLTLLGFSLAGLAGYGWRRRTSAEAAAV